MSVGSHGVNLLLLKALDGTGCFDLVWQAVPVPDGYGKRKPYTRHDKLMAKYLLPLVRLSIGVKYDVPGILISSLLILYIMISRDLSRISRAS